MICSCQTHNTVSITRAGYKLTCCLVRLRIDVLRVGRVHAELFLNRLFSSIEINLHLTSNRLGSCVLTICYFYNNIIVITIKVWCRSSDGTRERVLYTHDSGRVLASSLCEGHCIWSAISTPFIRSLENLYSFNPYIRATRNCSKQRKIHSGQGHTSVPNDFLIIIQISLTFRFSLIHIRINRSLQSFSHDTLVTAMLL